MRHENVKRARLGLRFRALHPLREFLSDEIGHRWKYLPATRLLLR